MNNAVLWYVSLRCGAVFSADYGFATESLRVKDPAGNWKAREQEREI